MLITEEYKQQLIQLHSDSPAWGTSGKKFTGIVQWCIGNYNPFNVLDYGCGKQTLARSLPQYRIRGYDPGLPGLDDTPEPHDLVICTDVLEHIEPECLEDVLDDLQRVTRKNLMVEVANHPAKARLPDGRNAHLIIQSNKWWLMKLWERFDLLSYEHYIYGFKAVFAALNPKGNGRS